MERELVRPMLAVPGVLPPPTEEDAWSFEMKWDGVRVVLYVEDGEPAAYTRNDRDVIASYPELRAFAAAQTDHQLVLDGEMVALDVAGRPDFGLLQQRMHLTKPVQVEAARAAVPAIYLVFDLLRLDGTSLLAADLRRPAWAAGGARAGR